MLQTFHFIVLISYFMKVSFFVGVTHESLRTSTVYPKSLCISSIWRHGQKMAGDKADDTKRLLRQCASSLLSACHRLERGETESSAPSFQTSANVINPPPYQDRPVASSSHTAIQEHMNLFGFNPSSSSQKASMKAVKRKRPGYGNKVPYCPIRNTWTHQVMCSFA